MKKLFTLLFLLEAGVILSNCNVTHEKKVASYKTIGHIEKLDPELDSIIDTATPIEVVAEGFNWVEGPLWVPASDMLLFSDVPENTIFQWTEATGIQTYLKPSGYTDTTARGGEMGSNGLLLSSTGKLILCQHGNRQIAEMNAPLDAPRADFISLAAGFDGHRLNSPNDITTNSSNELYFTDPPFGLVDGVNDTARELSFQGVYKIDSTGRVILLTDKLTRPNGITFSPDGSRLYVANCDAEHAYWMEYSVMPDGSLDSGRIFFDATKYVVPDKGLPDSMKMHPEGYLFAAAIDGLWIFDLTGKRLGIIHGEGKISNCAFDLANRTLYITNTDKILRVKLLR